MADLGITDLKEQIGVDAVASAEELLLPHLLRQLRMSERAVTHSDQLPRQPVEQSP